VAFLGRVFSADLRSLALYRVCVSLVLLYDLWVRSHDIVAHYTDQGILTREMAMKNLHYPLSFSLHMMSGHWFVQVLLFLIAAAAGFALLFGWRTRLATFVSWFLLLSLQTRNTLLLNAGDSILVITLFWGMFMPLGARYSIDAIKHSYSRKVIPDSISSLAVAAFMLQLGCLYWFSVVLKSGPAWHKDFTAVYYALHVREFITPTGMYLRQFEWILPFLTRVTIWTEVGAPLLLFLPFFGGRIRLFGVVALLGMHFSFQLCLNLGLFSVIPLIALFPLLPTVFWEMLERCWMLVKGFFLFAFLQTLVHGVSSLMTALFAPQSDREHRSFSLRQSLFSKVLVVCAFVVVFWANVASIKPSYTMPEWMESLHYALLLDQEWVMFAPEPSKYDSWYAIPGELADHSHIDVFKVHNNIPNPTKVNWDGYKHLSMRIRNYRWSNYYIRLFDYDEPKNLKVYWPRYIRYMCGQWNSNAPEQKQLIAIGVFMLTSLTKLNGTSELIENKRAWLGRCPDGQVIKEETDGKEKTAPTTKPASSKPTTKSASSKPATKSAH